MIKAEPSTAPIGISNVASGLGLEAQTEEEKKKTQEKSAELTKAVEEKVKAVSKEAKALSDKAQTFTDLALAVSSLEQAINALPEGNDKTQAEAKLKENQMKLDEAKKALEQARNDLKEAQTGLTKAEEAYEQNYKGYEKVVELVKKVKVRFNSDRTATGNIKVEMSQDGKGLEVKLSDQLKNMTSFETREVEGRKSTLNSNGLIVVNKGADNKVKSATYGAEAMVLSNQENGNKAVVTAGGVHFATTQAPATGARAGTGVITGLKDLDARSTGDMATNKNYVDEKVGSAVNRLDNAISTTNRRLQAGIAGALATGGLPITVMPGKSMLAASAGSYKGQSAVALGYSRMSDNGKIMLRLQGTSTSTGDVGGSVGVGYQW
ncbi:YadA-like family protein [Histophilus somni]|uniref:YadA C-terminal domain-containing protein n=1 Tax=Histophilus somni TaxID=731 RepID=UPI0018EA945C|nr:YadA-like family protein [Histophilus somni]QQF81311.1 YadA-like family protein [Histophilus somni]